MIKFLATDQTNGRTILGMIITEENIEAMKNDNPVHFNVEELPGMKKIECEEVLIIYYPTMEIALKDLEDKGYIPADAMITRTTKH